MTVTNDVPTAVVMRWHTANPLLRTPLSPLVAPAVMMGWHTAKTATVTPLRRYDRNATIIMTLAFSSVSPETISVMLQTFARFGRRPRLNQNAYVRTAMDLRHSNFHRGGRGRGRAGPRRPRIFSPQGEGCPPLGWEMVRPPMANWVEPPTPEILANTPVTTLPFRPGIPISLPWIEKR